MTARHFGIQSNRAGLGGLSADAAATHGSQYAPHDLFPPLPANSIYPSRSPLKRSDITQAMLDVLAVGAAFLFVSAAGCGLAFVLFVALLVRT